MKKNINKIYKIIKYNILLIKNKNKEYYNERKIFSFYSYYLFLKFFLDFISLNKRIYFNN
jgi:hypothetical protein